MHQCYVYPGSGSKLKYARTHIFLIAISGVTFVAAGLRLLHLGSKSLWVDECGSLAFAQQSWPAFWKTMWQGEANMLTYYLLLRGWIHFGNTEFIVRALSVIPAVATVFIIYRLGARLFSTSVGVVSALLLAVNACHVAYSQEARSYALLLFFLTLSILRFAIAIEDSTSVNWLLYALVTVAAIYTHFFAGLLMLAQWASLFFLPRKAVDLKKFCLSAVAIGLSILPALWFMLRKDVGQIDFIPNPGIMELYRLLLFLASYGGKVFGVLLAIVYVICLGMSLWVFSATWRESKQSIESWRFVLLLSCLLVPILTDMVISHSGKQIFNYRYLVICLPALLVLVARGFCCLRSQRIFVTGLVIVSMLSLATVWKYYAKPKENWRAATQYLLFNSGPSDTVVSYPWYAQQPLAYYQQQLHPASNTLHVVPSQFYAIDTSRLNHPEVVWLLSCREDEYLRSFRKHLSEVYPYHRELRYDGAIVVEQYSNQELTTRNHQNLDPVADSATLLFH